MAPAFVAIGERTGLWPALSRLEPVSVSVLAGRTGFSEGYVCGWLSGLVADGYVARDDEGRYRMADRW